MRPSPAAYTAGNRLKECVHGCATVLCPFRQGPRPDCLYRAGGGQHDRLGDFPDAGHCFKGVATGTGIARGKVRRLHHPAEGLALQPGEILVAPSTDPGWTPLFLKAGGLVVETGGYLSHAAIVAREFALPAVINLPGILAALADGEEVEVDGLRGEVRRL